jgi:hypothetical protein
MLPICNLKYGELGLFFLSLNYHNVMAPKQNVLKLPKKLIEQLGGESRFYYLW